ncbi:nitrate/sulfonate/bicarbonate ABC transporter ATP-binding protein [Terrihabitans soli]|uniref:Nitrate/sulfonate/bicarbonate ABC transporter ATP-binding protein n=1 Tax=Terrihabitans soli TaxID=708113 RepID=A0A6S6QPN8_9HYPH|nr:ABC transporter ATP-binding protein [Terrihabitans soli]BCJ89745.1 nitrate/sulfonate/bicarbonate ABC transporter ATP-binding protein [Terrihabitans soli]
MTMVRLNGVSKTFENGVQALDRFDLDIGGGDIVTLIGPSGCGKSTALRLIAGLDEPSEGQVEWPKGRPEIGYVFQEPTLMPWASAFNNIWLPLRLRGVSRADARLRVEEALELVGLTEFAEAKPHQLSGGMKMRVAIARALVTQPTLLLMDEPFAALDEITRFRLNDELLALKQRLFLTVVFVTHSIFEAVYLSSRVVVMTPRPGRTAEETAISEPFPRSEAFRTSVGYAGHAKAISSALRRATDESRLDKAALEVHS